ncbi:MAG: hypothetical protein FWB90_06855 [Fibromonadales bacterium]|nr:hypothetical protein [Fibromonadales bacterium]
MPGLVHYVYEEITSADIGTYLIAGHDTRTGQAYNLSPESLLSKVTIGSEDATVQIYNQVPGVFDLSIQGEIDRAEAAEQNLQTQIDTKQDKLTAGENIQITSNVISATDTIYDDAEVKSDIANIEAKIPNQANSDNQLADKDFVNSSISAMAANYVMQTAEGDTIWASLTALRAGPWYNRGESYTPTMNDYTVFSEADGSVWRATFDGVQWNKSFKVNDTPFTAAQIAVLNSGITSALVSKLGGIEAGAQVNVIEAVAAGTGISVSASGKT